MQIFSIKEITHDVIRQTADASLPYFEEEVQDCKDGS